mmetsp:Transcript_22958/g.63725  ORF Transcript_22958/g.63725 Transcript_22958/m.63725 type:complete len:282 (+) Transcript_22958:376-1221(+)
MATSCRSASQALGGRLCIDAILVRGRAPFASGGHRSLPCRPAAAKEGQDAPGAGECLPGQQRPDLRPLLLLAGGPHDAGVLGHVKLALEAGGRHAPHSAKDRALGEGPVVPPKAPRDAHIAVLVSAIELILVVEVNRPLHGCPGVGCPLDKPLAPVHAHVVMHVACDQHLPLRCVPVGVACVPLLQLPQGVHLRTRVGLMEEQAVMGPVGHCRPPVVAVGQEPGQVASQLPPDYQLLKESSACRGPCKAAVLPSIGQRPGSSLLHCYCHLQGRDVAKVEVW